VHNLPPSLGSSAQPLPSHPGAHYGTLPNGFSYVVLPNPSPGGRFEAHLQVFTGSADELHSQQGLAHLTEHVAYMGSRKRERLFGTGSQTNAYTDFHHTVFYAACPARLPGGREPMLPLAFDALREVMEAEVDPGRLEKERAAVLSEMTMVNTIEYRVECQILSTLHRENRLAKRFPIGKEALIRGWQRRDVLEFHRTHYRPDNVLLYVVGDLDVGETEAMIAKKFGGLDADRHAGEMSGPARDKAGELARAVAATVKSGQSWHYPPVVHTWSERGEPNPNKPPDAPASAPASAPPSAPPLQSSDLSSATYDTHLQKLVDMDDSTLNSLPEVLAPNGALVRPHLFSHPLLQSFSLHLFAKRRVSPTRTLPGLKASLARRIVLAAMQIRLNVNARGDDPPFTFVEFNQLDSAREGCAVCSFDLMADKGRWEEALFQAVGEVCKLGKFGVTTDEMLRYGGALLTDAAQLAAQGDRVSHADQLSHLMESVACGHTFMSPRQAYEATDRALAELTLDEVNAAAAELCEHVTSLGDGEPKLGGPVIAIACSPTAPSERNPGAPECDPDR
jgi:predicted Zn-dependent peptidase